MEFCFVRRFIVEFFFIEFIEFIVIKFVKFRVKFLEFVEFIFIEFVKLFFVQQLFLIEFLVEQFFVKQFEWMNTVKDISNLLFTVQNELPISILIVITSQHGFVAYTVLYRS